MMALVSDRYERMGLRERTGIALVVMRYQVHDGHYRETIVEERNVKAVAAQYGAKIALVPNVVETIAR